MAKIAISNAYVADISVDSMFQRLTSDLATVTNIRLERPTPNTLVIYHRHVPGWAKILGILGLLFFLIGLIFFAVKTTETATVLGSDVEGGASFTVTGTTSSTALQSVYRAFGADMNRVGYPLPPAPPGRSMDTPTTEAAASTDTASTASELERIAALHASGALDDDEFRQSKRRLLGV